MEKEYNLSKLFKENEFDVQKGYKRCGTKEAYFSVLYRFTIDSESLLERCRPELYKNSEAEIETLARYVEMLQGMLANIGAIKLAWRLQGLNNLLDKKYYSEYLRKLGEILPLVKRLRKRIISAEKRILEHTEAPHSAPAERSAAVPAAVKQAKPRLSDFEKLILLIENFEFDSAVKAIHSITRYSYTADIDMALADVKNALNELNYTKSLEEAQKLLALAANAPGHEKSLKKNILAIDDMPDVLRTIKAMLKSKYNVFGMTNYDSAIKFLRSNTADLILLDIEMPGLDGFAMLQLFRKIPEYSDTPMVFLTSNVSDEHVNMATSLGASGFIKKPIDVETLLAKLDSAISGNVSGA